MAFFGRPRGVADFAVDFTTRPLRDLVDTAFALASLARIMDLVATIVGLPVVDKFRKMWPLTYLSNVQQVRAYGLTWSMLRTVTFLVRSKCE